MRGGKKTEQHAVPHAGLVDVASAFIAAHVLRGQEIARVEETLEV